MQFARIPAGTFEFYLDPFFGEPRLSYDSRPFSTVAIDKPFELSIHEVTVGQFRKFVEATGYVTELERGRKDDRFRWSGKDFEQGVGSWKDPGFEQTDEHPVVGVTPADAHAFCDWLNGQTKLTHRLPTEAEWQHAYRAGTNTEYYFGDTGSERFKHGNVRDASVGNVLPRKNAFDLYPSENDGHPFTAPVGSFAQHPYGLFDMQGNVTELTTKVTGYQRLLSRSLTKIEKDLVEELTEPQEKSFSYPTIKFNGEQLDLSQYADRHIAFISFAFDCEDHNHQGCSFNLFDAIKTHCPESECVVIPVVIDPRNAEPHPDYVAESASIPRTHDSALVSELDLDGYPQLSIVAPQGRIYRVPIGGNNPIGDFSLTGVMAVKKLGGQLEEWLKTQSGHDWFTRYCLKTKYPYGTTGHLDDGHVAHGDSFLYGNDYHTRGRAVASGAFEIGFRVLRELP